MTTVRGKRSRASLKAFLTEDDKAGDFSLMDPRAKELRLLSGDDPVALDVIREVFAGTRLPEDREKVRHILRARSEIQKEWGAARDSFLAIGRALIALELELTKAEFSKLRHGTDRLFPFSDATATQLRQIARAVDSGRIAAEACPGSYGTAYQITLLSERQLVVARERGLIRPDVTRREIMQLRREVAADGMEPFSSGRLDRSRFREERARLGERRARLLEELVAIERRIKHLDELLSPMVEGKAEVVSGA